MAEKSKISWTENTWNPFHGCKKVSDGCKYCYMFRDKERFKLDPTDVVKAKKGFDAPLKWKEPTLIFTCSWSDWFIEEGDEWRDELWKIIKATPHHTYQILTKRPERILECLPDDWGDGYDNVWIGVSAENQKNLEDRVNYLYHIPAKVKFISAEPLLSDLDFDIAFWSPESGIHHEDAQELLDVIDWVIIGGESGNDNGKYLYRPAELRWFKNIIQQCKNYGTPVFMKQTGTYLSKKLNLNDRHGADISEWDKNLQIQEFPDYKK